MNFVEATAEILRIEGINEIKSLNPDIHVRVNCTVTQHNMSHLVELADDLNNKVTIDPKIM